MLLSLFLCVVEGDFVVGGVVVGGVAVVEDAGVAVSMVQELIGT